MGPKFKKLVNSKELINLYLDICEDILINLVFDGSNKDKNNLYLFLSSLEQSLDFLASDVSSILNLDSKTCRSRLSSRQGLCAGIPGAQSPLVSSTPTQHQHQTRGPSPCRLQGFGSWKGPTPPAASLAETGNGARSAAPR